MPLRYNTLVPMLFPIQKVLFNLYRSKPLERCRFISSIVADLGVFIGFFSFRKKRQSHIAQSSEWWLSHYCCGTLRKISLTRNNERTDAVSSCFYSELLLRRLGFDLLLITIYQPFSSRSSVTWFNVLVTVLLFKIKTLRDQLYWDKYHAQIIRKINDMPRFSLWHNF